MTAVVPATVGGVDEASVDEDKDEADVFGANDEVGDEAGDAS